MFFVVSRHWMIVLALALGAMFSSLPQNATAQVTAFKQAVAEAAARDADISAFYKANGYESLWTGRSGRERQRRTALFAALSKAGNHGLPAARYDAGGLQAKMKAVKTERDRGLVEVELSRTFLQYARDLQTGVLVPSRVNKSIVRALPYRDRTSYLVNFSKSSPNGFFKALAPKTTEYNALMKEKLLMERLLAQGGWGAKVPAKTLKPGQSGASVVALRNRLIAMGFLKRTNTQAYDTSVQAAVQQFQLAHGLAADGVVGAGTMKELNTGVQERLQSIIVAMERERWVNQERGKRHVLVNIPDFTAKIVDNGKVTFSTRSVVGANKQDRPTVEFSDVMEFMVVNPSWYVPRSIVVGEYLPALQRDPNAVRHIEITDSRGRAVNRGSADFSQYTARTFPYAMRQPPSKGNALGLVKFMFPNPYNIYLHDTPAKNLFAREARAYSHGCVRLADPFDFAYALLAKQESNPESYFQSVLATGRETRVDLKNPVPVHIIYRTAFTTPKGRTQYRRDVYGRDAQIWRALSKAGVALRAVQG
ncbi:L,D-transpeptidase family protein [Tateyamaria sp.]|uniref:L,D-transpeptidase family protein n=1 Tax=Tateyamaria sp. TaxID=1929288 RepID=UPI0039B8CDB3